MCGVRPVVDSSSIIRSPEFHFLVGHEQSRLTVHTGIVRNLSPPLYALINNSMMNEQSVKYNAQKLSLHSHIHTRIYIYSVNLTESHMSMLTQLRKPASYPMPTSRHAVPVDQISHPQQQIRTVLSTASNSVHSIFASVHRYYPSFYIPDIHIDPAQAIKATVHRRLHHHQFCLVLLPCVSRGWDSSGWMGEYR